MFFHLAFFILTLISPTWTLISCPKCVTTIDLTQSVEIPITCTFIDSDFCTANAALDYNASSIRLDLDGKMRTTSSESLFNTSVSYMSYFDLQQINIMINMDVKCSFEDRCAFHIVQRQIQKIVKETTPTSAWVDLISKLTDIVLAPPGSVTVEQCYKPDDAIEKCRSENDVCNVEHIFPLETIPDLSFKSPMPSSSSRWRAGCATDPTAPFVLTMGYSL